MQHNFIYPATPAGVPDSITEPSPAFKKEVSGVMGSIVFFFIVYIILLLLSLVLVAGCVWAGIALIINLPKLITIAAGLGLIGVGVMVFVFLVKFMFSVSKYDRSGIIEIKEAEQPRLFGFIRQLAKDTQTPFPKKIYLSADVNACVFYDSSFWSMFFPVRKNLQIGIGLVNAINVSEFKAVMAHEFGHFSQRSMKLGSFVYNVNKIIHNMLFENRSFSSFLQGWANIDGIFAFFASITAGIARGIQGVLRQMYGLINKSYMRLSREMEFHADAVAASVSGSISLVTALRRIEFAYSAYSLTIDKCDQLYRQNKISANIYPNQAAMMLLLAEQYKLPVQGGLPLISDEFMKHSNHTRINYKDQWASHPTTEDREKNLRQLNVEAEISDESAWVLFADRDGIEMALTGKIYEHVKRETDTTTIGETEFAAKLDEDRQRFSFPEVYNGYYDGRQIAISSAAEIGSTTNDKDFNELFSTDHALLAKKIAAAAQDIEVLKAIADRRIDTKTFDFDGVKYDHGQAAQVIAQLEGEMKQMQSAQEQLDRQVIRFFYDRAALKGEEHIASLQADYEAYFNKRIEADNLLNSMNGTLTALQPIFSGETLTLEQVQHIIGNVKSDHEPLLKNKLRSWFETGVFNNESLLHKRISTFLGSDYAYFSGTSFFEQELEDLTGIINESWGVVHAHIVAHFKAILEKQLQFAGKVNSPGPALSGLSVP